jgi:hypothetical protein
MKRRVATGRTYAPYEVVLRLEQVAQGRGLSYCQHFAVRWRSKKGRGSGRNEGRKVVVEKRRKGLRDEDKWEGMMVEGERSTAAQVRSSALYYCNTEHYTILYFTDCTALGYTENTHIHSTAHPLQCTTHPLQCTSLHYTSTTMHCTTRKKHTYTALHIHYTALYLI